MGLWQYHWKTLGLKLYLFQCQHTGWQRLKAGIIWKFLTWWSNNAMGQWFNSLNLQISNRLGKRSSMMNFLYTTESKSLWHLQTNHLIVVDFDTRYLTMARNNQFHTTSHSKPSSCYFRNLFWSLATSHIGTKTTTRWQPKGVFDGKGFAEIFAVRNCDHLPKLPAMSILEVWAVKLRLGKYKYIHIKAYINVCMCV